MGELAKFSITTKPNGTGTFEINGEDLSDRVRAATVQIIAGQAPVITIQELVAGGDLQGEGVVYVQKSSDVNGIVSFLDAIDPDELERVSLERMGWGDSTMRAILDTLKEWAGARS